MTALTVTEIGSVVLNMIENVPDAVSGVMPTIVNQEIYNAENYTGVSIGTSVADEYQPAIFSLVSASVTNMMSLIGADVNSIKLGDLSVSKGSNSNTADVSAKWRADGMDKLTNLGGVFTFYKSNGS